MPNWKKVITSGSAAVLSDLTLSGVTQPEIKFNGSSDAGVDFAIRATPEGLDFYEPEDSNKIHMQIIDDGGVDAKFGLKIGGTSVLSSGRALSNVTGNISMFTNNSGYKTTFRTVTAGGNTLGANETLAFSAGENVSISESGGTITISSTDTNTDTNTVTSIRRDNTGTYRTGNINLVGGSNVTITETSAGVFSIASTDTNTNTTYSPGSLLDLSGTTFNVDLSELTDMTQAWVNSTDEFVVLDSGVQKRKLGSEIFGDNAFNSTTIPSAANNATITISAGNALTTGGNFTTNQGSNETITIHHADTSTQSSVNGSGRTYIQDITLDTYGHVTAIGTATETVVNTDTNTNQLTTFQVEDGDGTEVTISHGKEWKFLEGQGINVNWTDVTPGSDADPFDLQFALKENGVRANELNVSGNGTTSQFLRSDGDGSFTWATPTKSQIGLGNVANESRATILGGNLTGTINSIAVGTVTAGAALGATSNQDSTSTIRSGTTKANVGLSNVANESRATILGGNLTGTINSVAVATVTAGAALGATSNQDSTSTIRSGTTKANVGLSNVANESRATILASAALTGTPTAPTATANTNTTQIATTAYVQTEITDLIGGAPGTLNTLNELAAAINDDASYASTLTTALGTKLPKSGGTMTGAIAMGNSNITGVNALTFADPGPNEGLSWTGGNMKLYESPNDLTTNTAGNLQIVYGTTRRLTIDNTGINVNGNATLSGFVLDGNTITGVDDSGEFTDNDAHIMTSAGVDDRITSRISGLTSNAGTMTGITINTATGLDGGSTLTGTGGTINLSLDLSEFTDMTADVVGSQDELILLDNGAERKKMINEIKLSQFNNDAGFTSHAAANNATITLSGGGGITTSIGNFTTNQSSAETLTISHDDTSTQASSNNSNGTVIQDVTLDTYGHVTGLGTYNLDGRYFTESESDARFLGISATAADSTLLGGIGLGAASRNNVANKVVRTDGSGYANFGWINTTSGNTTATITDVYVNTNDGYIRKATKAEFQSQMGIQTLNSNTDVDTGTETVLSVDDASIGIFFDYVVSNGTNLRAGTVTAVHDGTNVEFTETSTNDLGDTTDLVLSVDLNGGNVRLRATAASDNWSVKTIARLI